MSDKALKTAMENHLREIAFKVPRLSREGKGVEVLGPVPGRPEDEDLEIGVDRVCEEVLESHLRSTGLRIDVHSEHGLIEIGGDGPPQYLAACDPFDGSGLFRRGLPSEWWSVVTFYGLDRTPIMGGAVDILRKEMYIADRGGVTLVSLEDEARTPVLPSGKTGLDDDTVIAAYLMDPSYLSDWVARMRGFLDRFPRIRLWPNGGSCIYPWIARGLVHAYVMFGEPRSEIDPGLAFAWASGYETFSVSESGSPGTYRFAPARQAERVPFFVAACTKGLAEDIISEIRIGNVPV